MNKKVHETLNMTFRALKHRNYRLFFAGQCISLTGTWIQQVAMSWLIYSMTNSPLLMGVIMFAGSAPSLLISPYAGVITDRVNKYKTLILVQTIFMLGAFAIAALTLLGVIKVWQIVILTVLMGITNAFDMPLRQAFVVQLVADSNDLGNAISLNSSSFNLARLIGPAVAGMLIASFGEGICFLLNALSYIAVIYALWIMNIEPEKYKKDGKFNVWEEFKEGFDYTCASPAIKNTILFIAISSLLGMSYQVLMPIYAKEILHGNAQTMGFLMSASGVGALIGALYLAGRKFSKGLEKWICYAALLFGMGLSVSAFIHKMWMALPIFFVIGFSMVVIIASCNTLIQSFVSNDKRGRVMSLYTMAFMGTAPLGSLMGGAIADRIGILHTFLLCGMAMMVAALFFSTKLKHFKQA